MSRKDYILIANCVNKAIKTSHDKISLANDIISNLKIELKRDNINFRSDKFIKACLE